MKKILLAATALTALSVSAVAADLPKRAVAPAAPAPIFSWTGFYVGGTVGALYANNKNSDAYNTNPGDSSTSNASSASVGLTAGYNYQIGNYVVGAEADYSFANARAKDVGGHNSNSFGDFGTVRGRVGYAMDRTLFFVTAGLAVANIKGESHECCSTGFSKKKLGWVAGAGIEQALSNNLTLKVEALYTDFGKQSASEHYAGGCGLHTFTAKTSSVLGRVGVNFKF